MQKIAYASTKIVFLNYIYLSNKSSQFSVGNDLLTTKSLWTETFQITKYIFTIKSHSIYHGYMS